MRLGNKLMVTSQLPNLMQCQQREKTGSLNDLEHLCWFVIRLN